MKKLLVVDNEIDILALYARELGNDGYEVTVAANARQALEYFRVDRPDLVVLDICLPGMDGLEAMGHMLSIDRTVPVVFASAYSHYKDNFLSWVADAYVDKASDLTVLKQTIRDVLTSRSRASHARI